MGITGCVDEFLELTTGDRSSMSADLVYHAAVADDNIPLATFVAQHFGDTLTPMLRISYTLSGVETTIDILSSLTDVLPVSSAIVFGDVSVSLETQLCLLESAPSRSITIKNDTADFISENILTRMLDILQRTSRDTLESLTFVPSPKGYSEEDTTMICNMIRAYPNLTRITFEPQFIEGSVNMTPQQAKLIMETLIEVKRQVESFHVWCPYDSDTLNAYICLMFGCDRPRDALAVVNLQDIRDDPGFVADTRLWLENNVEQKDTLVEIHTMRFSGETRKRYNASHITFWTLSYVCQRTVSLPLLVECIHS